MTAIVRKSRHEHRFAGWRSVTLVIAVVVSAWADGHLSKVVAQQSGDDSQNASPSRRRQTGSAFFVGTEGHLLTNWHVTSNCKMPAIEAEGRATPVRILVEDRAIDLALLKSDRSGGGLNLRERAHVGEPVAVLGYPVMQQPTKRSRLTLGVVTVGSSGNSLVQTNAQVQVGQSGSPLLDGSGDVLGVVFGHTPSRTLAVSARTASDFMRRNGVAAPMVSEGGTPRPITGLAEYAGRFVVEVVCER